LRLAIRWSLRSGKLIGYEIYQGRQALLAINHLQPTLINFAKIDGRDWDFEQQRLDQTRRQFRTKAPNVLSLKLRLEIELAAVQLVSQRGDGPVGALASNWDDHLV
jgi:hypothetical protein